MAAAARGSGRASAPGLLLLLLVPLLWAPAGVRAVPDEALSHRNKEPPAPAQQLQPQPAAVQGPEPARVEVSGKGPGGRGCGAGGAGYQARRCRSAALDSGCRRGEGSSAPASRGGRPGSVPFPGGPWPLPAPYGGGESRAGGHCKPLVRQDADAAEEEGVLLIRWILES